MIRWRDDRIAKGMQVRGWENASQLALGAGLTYPVASRIVNADGKAIERIDVSTLEALARAFDCEPWDLLEYDPARKPNAK